jgi:hypothetical protein
MAAVFGFLAGLFGVISLLAFGVMAIDSVWVTVVPFLTLLLAFSLAMWAPIGRAGETPPAAPSEPAPPDPGGPPADEPPPPPNI